MVATTAAAGAAVAAGRKRGRPDHEDDDDDEDDNDDDEETDSDDEEEQQQHQRRQHRGEVQRLKGLILDCRDGLLEEGPGKLHALCEMGHFKRATGGKDLSPMLLKEKIGNPVIARMFTTFVNGCSMLIKEQDLSASQRVVLTLMCGSGKDGGGGSIMRFLVKSIADALNADPDFQLPVVVMELGRGLDGGDGEREGGREGV